MSIKNVPVLVLNNVEILPSVEIRLDYDDVIIRKTVENAEKYFNGQLIVVTKSDPLEVNINFDELLTIGVLSNVTMNLEMPGSKYRANIKGEKRISIREFYQEEDIIYAKTNPLLISEVDPKEELAYIKLLKDLITEYIDNDPYKSNAIMSQIKEINSLDNLTDLITISMTFNNNRKQEYLLEIDQVKRARMLIKDIRSDFEIVKLEKDIEDEVDARLDKSQRDFYLNEKIKVIKEELGEEYDKDEEINEFKRRLDNIDVPTNIRQKIEKEIKRLSVGNFNNNPDYNMVRNYIELILDLPWNNYCDECVDIENIKKTLDKNHYGLEKVKSRILEHIAVLKNTNNRENTIICLVGPPGVGKTTIAKSIAEALNKKWTKISVGGINDEADIVGHRRTYIGAQPGLIIQGIRKTGVNDPVFIIDEIDKMTKSIHGDPASSLLEVLDKEQNSKFMDHYVEEEYDLSKVMFITTANYIEQIPNELIDRLEIMELSSYTEYEKIDILKNYIIPKKLEEYNLNKNEIKIKDDALLYMLKSYTREAGVREAERCISKIFRRYIKDKIFDNKKSKLNITIDNITKYLDKEIYMDLCNEEKSQVGVVNGLSYTPYGGNTLKVEATLYKGNGNLILTGSLGDVLKESATLCLSYIKANSKDFGIANELFKNNDIHIHFEEGAVKKDGPSAGIALTTVLISVLTNSKVPNNAAMTGEMTLRGKVLPIGGLKEKVIGAYNKGINRIFIPVDNRNDLDEVDDKIKNSIEFIYVNTYMDIYNILFKYSRKSLKKKSVINEDMLIKLDI